MTVFATLSSIASGPRYVLIACQPKSASTFLAAALGRLPQSRTVSLVPAYGRREQELSEERIRRYRFRGNRLVAAQHHLCYSDYTGSLIRKHGLRTLVLVRNLFDVIASNRDHIRAEDVAAPMFYLPPDMATASDEELEQIIAAFAIPWYIKFYLSWLDCPDVLWLDYTDVTRAPARTIERIVDFADSGFTGPEIAAAIAAIPKASTRFNQGQTGRGAAISPETRRMVQAQVSLYSRRFPHPYLLQHLD